MTPSDGLTSAEKAAVRRLEAGIAERTVIPVVGAGVSRQTADLPSWGTLLSRAIKWTEENKESLRVTASELDELQALSVAAPTLSCYDRWVDTTFCRDPDERHWKMPLYRAWLEEVFGAESATDKRIYRALGAMDPRVVVTTNYDKLLTHELMQDGDVVTWNSEESIRALLRERRGVLYLHGTYDEPESVVLTATDYERIGTEDERSSIAKLLTSHSILLFVGISPAGATDRHLAKLLRLGMPPQPNDAPQRKRSHVLLHRGKLTATESARLKALDIEPVRFGDEYSDLAPFLERLSGRSAAVRTATELIGLDDHGGESLSQSRWAPQHCLDRIESSLRFMGLRSSKWVSDDKTLEALDRVLGVLNQREAPAVRFLILNPECEAFQRLEDMRGIELSSDHLAQLAQLEQRHESLVIKCVDFISAFRFTAVNDKEVGLALYPTDPTEFKESKGGWTARHHSLHTRQRWSLARSLLFMFDEHFRNAKPLRKVKPELFG